MTAKRIAYRLRNVRMRIWRSPQAVTSMLAHAQWARFTRFARNLEMNTRNLSQKMSSRARYFTLLRKESSVHITYYNAEKAKSADNSWTIRFCPFLRKLPVAHIKKDRCKQLLNAVRECLCLYIMYVNCKCVEGYNDEQIQLHNRTVDYVTVRILMIFKHLMSCHLNLSIISAAWRRETNNEIRSMWKHARSVKTAHKCKTAYVGK